MKATQNQFLFTRIGDDVTNSKKPWDSGAEVFGVDGDLFFMHGSAPLRNGAELRGES